MKLIILLLIAAGTAGCITSAPQAEPTGKAAGSFAIYYSAPDDTSYFNIYNSVREGGVFDRIADALNRNIILPRDVWIIFDQCGATTSYYDPQDKKIKICYEFLKYMENLYTATNATPNVTGAAINNAEFVLYHEVGHALIDVLDIPTTGREEDSADQLATLMVLGKGNNYDAPLLATAFSFAVQGQLQAPDSLKFWNEHSLDSQRYYNILCWLYGENPAKYGALASKFLPEERAIRCEYEYAKMSSSWSRLLEPYMKK